MSLIKELLQQHKKTTNEGKLNILQMSWYLFVASWFTDHLKRNIKEENKLRGLGKCFWLVNSTLSTYLYWVSSVAMW